jgi:hypothetical protein
MASTRSRKSAVGRRVASISGVCLLWIVLLASAPVWIIAAGLYDSVRLKFRFPHVRLLAFGVLWATLEGGGCGCVGCFFGQEWLWSW